MTRPRIATSLPILGAFVLALGGGITRTADAAVLCVVPSDTGKVKGEVLVRPTKCKKKEVEIELAVLDALTARIDALEAQVTAAVTAAAFISVVEEEIEGLAGPHVIIEGANLHVRSGSGATDDDGTPSGLGNLVIGYNEAPDSLDDGRGGAHNLVIGPRNQYSSTAGMVAGADNVISGEQATITGGRFGTASGRFSHIGAGGGDTENLFNTASGEFATITGGFRSVASGNQSSVSGGSNHDATGFLSSVSGGTSNTASGAGAAVSGGAGNDATSSNSAISGGQQGVAVGVSSSIYGGLETTTNANFAFAPLQ